METCAGRDSNACSWWIGRIFPHISGFYADSVPFVYPPSPQAAWSLFHTVNLDLLNSMLAYHTGVMLVSIRTIEFAGIRTSDHTIDPSQTPQPLIVGPVCITMHRQVIVTCRILSSSLKYRKIYQ